jgi:hypothetical protein
MIFPFRGMQGSILLPRENCRDALDKEYSPAFSKISIAVLMMQMNTMQQHLYLAICPNIEFYKPGNTALAGPFNPCTRVALSCRRAAVCWVCNAIVALKFSVTTARSSMLATLIQFASSGDGVPS